MLRLLASCCCLVGLASSALGQAAPPAPPTDLFDYLKKPEAVFAWKQVSKTPTPQGTITILDLTSQTWQGIVWKHQIELIVPKDVTPTATMVLYNTGGKPNATTAMLGLQIAQLVKAPVAFLYGIPNQPLFGGKTEDALIAETFVKYLETEDGSWPLLFPMVKSLLKAMDAIQAHAMEDWKFEVKQFVVTGASKRGWTSWLTGASGDPRVKAIAPLVIDTLNFPKQMTNQVEAFGKPSLMIADYTRRGLVPIPDSGAAKKLWQMVDPWMYRGKLTLPKLIVNGTNDPYWPQDALNSYWNDLAGDKHLLYVPNAGHDLRCIGDDGKKELLPMKAVNTLAAFCRSQIFDKPMPQLTWEYQASGDFLMVKPIGTVKALTLWRADSETRDFRGSKWTGEVALKDQETKKYDGTLEVGYKLKPNAQPFQAMFGEVTFDYDGIPLNLSTQIRIEVKK